MPSGTYAVVLSTTVDRMQEIEVKIRNAGIFVSSIFETNGKYTGELMALGIEPLPRNKLKPYLSSLPLLK